jgi:hypothetical protein
MSILVLTSDTLSSPAAAGQIEYSSPIYAATPIGTQRGIVPTQQYYRLNAAVVGADTNSAQSIFGVGVTLSASTVYEFEALYVFSKTAGATSHSLGFGFGGTATINNILYETSGGTIVSSTPSGTLITNASYYLGSIANSTANTVAFSSITVAGICFSYIVRGTVSINAGGTFIPQYTLSAAPGGAYSTVAGSYFRINPLSASGAATNVGTWA